MHALSSITQKLNAILNLLGRAKTRLGILKISWSSGAKMGCLQSTTSVRHAYPSLCNYFFAENNLKKQYTCNKTTYTCNKTLLDYLALLIRMLHAVM